MVIFSRVVVVSVVILICSKLACSSLRSKKLQNERKFKVPVLSMLML